MKAYLSILLCLVFSVSAYGSVKIGKSAPDFTLKGHDGKSYTLSDLKGKFVVLEWFNNDCPYVRKHYDAKYRNMQKLQEKWIEKGKKGGKDLVWLSIISSAPGKQGYVSAKEASQIKEQERNAYMDAILFDPTGKVGKMYGAKTTPHMYIIDPKGTLEYMGAIDDKPSARLSSLDGAKNYVDKGLTTLFAGKEIKETSTKPYGCSVKY